MAATTEVQWVEKKAGQREAAPVAETVESMDRHWADHLVARSGMLMDGTKAAMWAESWVVMRVAGTVSLSVVRTVVQTAVYWVFEWGSWKVATTDACWAVRTVGWMVVWTENPMVVQMVPGMVQWSVGRSDDWRAAWMAQLKADSRVAVTGADSVDEKVRGLVEYWADWTERKWAVSTASLPADLMAAWTAVDWAVVMEEWMVATTGVPSVVQRVPSMVGTMGVDSVEQRAFSTAALRELWMVSVKDNHLVAS